MYLFLLHLDMLIYVQHRINAYSSNAQEKYSTLYSVKTYKQCESLLAEIFYRASDAKDMILIDSSCETSV